MLKLFLIVFNFALLHLTSVAIELVQFRERILLEPVAQASDFIFRVRDGGLCENMY